MQVNTYLNFNGNGIRFPVLRGIAGRKSKRWFRMKGRRRGTRPGRVAKQNPSRREDLGGTVLMGSDAPDERYQGPQGFAVSLQTETPEEAERAFQALSTGGSVRMPIQETFFATRFGMLVDQFGVPWMINCAPSPIQRPA